MILGEIGEDLAVKFNVRFFKLIYKFAVGKAVLSGGGVDFNLPQPAEVALFLFPVGELKRPSVKQSFFGLAVFGLSRPHKTLRMFQQSFASSVCLYSSFYSWHRLQISR